MAGAAPPSPALDGNLDEEEGGDGDGDEWQASSPIVTVWWTKWLLWVRLSHWGAKGWRVAGVRAWTVSGVTIGKAWRRRWTRNQGESQPKNKLGSYTACCERRCHWGWGRSACPSLTPAISSQSAPRRSLPWCRSCLPICSTESRPIGHG